MTPEECTCMDCGADFEPYFLYGELIDDICSSCELLRNDRAIEDREMGDS